MMRRRIQGLGFIIMTLIIAMMLDLFPLPSVAVWFRPHFTVLVFLYWVLAFPFLINVGSAFLVGLLLDLLQGSMLGEHAFAMIVVAYIMILLHRFLRVYPLFQQALFICLVLLIYQLIVYVIQGVIGELPKTVFYWAPILTSTILWPWLFVLLRDWRRRLGMTG